MFYGWQLTRTFIPPDWGDLKPNPAGQPRWPKWITDRIGPDYYSSAKMALIFGAADPVMPQVGRLEGLEELDFLPAGKDRAIGPTDEGMVHLRNLTRLKHLSLGVNTANGPIGSKITGKGLASIAGAIRLQILDLQGARLSGSDLVALRGMTDLRNLNIDSPVLTDEGLAHLAGMIEMRRLDLARTRVTSAGIAHLASLTRLENLNLILTGVESLETCRTLPGLTNLDLAKTPIGDAGLAPASSPGFARLIRLNLLGTRIGNEGLRSLRDLPKLRSLVLIETAVSDAAVAELKKDRPTLSVVQRLPPARPRPARAKK